MSEGPSKKSMRLYAAAFVIALASAGTLLANALTRSLSAKLSLASIALSIVAVLLGALALRA